MTKVQFNEWVERMIRKAKNEQLSNDCEMRTVKDVIICVDRNRNVGIAKCHPDDEFNPLIGRAIAYARCKGIEVPKVTNCKRLSEMVNGDTFKMKISGYYYRYIGKDEFNRYVCRNITTNRYDAFFDKDEYEMVE